MPIALCWGPEHTHPNVAMHSPGEMNAKRPKIAGISLATNSVSRSQFERAGRHLSHNTGDFHER